MKIAIYGCGEFGKQFINRIKNNTIELVGIIDNNVVSYEKYRLWNVCEFCSKKIDVNYIIVTMKWIRNIKEIIRPLIDAGYCVKYIPNYYSLYHIDYSINAEFIENECEMLSELDIDYIEMHVQDDCNLNCKCCSHFSPLFKTDSSVDFQTFCNDIARLKEINKRVIMLRLLGGEPFLNRNLDLYIKETRKSFPHTDIRICSNGILMPKLESKIVNAIRENHVVVDISLYKPTAKMRSAIEKFARKNGICIKLSGEVIDRFQYCFTRDINDIFSPCVINCINIYKGKFSKCPQLMFIHKYNAYYGKEYPEQGIFDLYDTNLNAEKFIGLCSKDIPLCRYCLCKEESFLNDKYMTEWECVGNKEVLADEWLWVQHN